MKTHKTQSLAYPNNPLAAMRELQNLDLLPKIPSTTRSRRSITVPRWDRGHSMQCTLLRFR